MKIWVGGTLSQTAVATISAYCNDELEVAQLPPQGYRGRLKQSAKSTDILYIILDDTFYTDIAKLLPDIAELSKVYRYTSDSELKEFLISHLGYPGETRGVNNSSNVISAVDDVDVSLGYDTKLEDAESRIRQLEDDLDQANLTIDELNRRILEGSDSDDISALTSKIKSLEADIKAKATEIDTLHNELDIEKSKAVDSSELDNLRKELDNTQSALVKEKEDRAALTYSNNALNQELFDANKTVQDLQDKLTEAESKLKSVSDELDSVAGKNSGVEVELTDLKGRLDEASKKASELDALKEQYSNSELQVKNLGIDLQNKEAKLAEITTSLSNLENEKKELESKLGVLESEKQVLEGETSNRVSVLESEKATLESEKATLESEKATLESEKATLESEKATLEVEKSGLETRIDSLTAETENLQAQIDELTRQLEATKNEVGEKIAEIERISSELEDMTHQKEEVVNALADLQASLSTSGAEKDTKISELEIQNQAIQTELDNLQTQLADYVAIKTQYSGLESTITQLQTDIQTAQTDKDTLEAQNKEYIGKIVELQGDVAKLENTVQNLTTKAETNATLSTKVTELDEQVLSLKKENATLSVQLSSAKKIADAKGDLVSMQTELTKLKAENDDLRVQLVQAESSTDEGIFTAIGNSAMVKATYNVVLPIKLNLPDDKFMVVASGSMESCNTTYNTIKETCAKNPNKNIIVLDLVTETSIDIVLGGTPKPLTSSSWLSTGEALSSCCSPTSNPRVKVISTAFAYFNDTALLCIDWEERLSELARCADMVIIYTGCLNSMVSRILFTTFSSFMTSYIGVKATPLGLRGCVLYVIGLTLSNKNNTIVAISNYDSSNKTSLALIEKLKRQAQVKVLTKNEGYTV